MSEKELEGKKRRVSRRDFLFAGGAGVAGLVVGGVVGNQVIPLMQPKAAPTVKPLPVSWISRDYAACTGCRNCEVACSQTKEKVSWPATSRIKVYEYPPGVEFPVVCYQCDDPRCAAACPKGALSRDEASGTIKVDTTKCLRTTEGGECTLCTDNCPAGTIAFHPTTSAPLVCDMCGGDPACVKVCPSGAIALNGARAGVVANDQIALSLARLYEVPKAPEASKGGFQEIALAAGAPKA